MSSKSNNIFPTGYVLNDKWVIIEFIDKGAMGEVYRAHQLNLKRDVAIKVISQEMLLSFEDDSEEIENAVQRFRREVEAMARVRHPNVLQIYDYDSDLITTKGQELPVEYIVMEFIPGTSLRFTMSEEGFYPEQDLTTGWIVDYFLPLLEGVEAIHAQEIAHRDLKPENVLLDGTIPKIADFGLAGSSRMKPVTQTIDVRGTPAYMSPEHFFDFKKADQQSDIYSLGRILFEAVDGKLGKETIPFKSVNLQNPDTPFLQRLDRVIQDATAEKKEDRLKSVEDFRNRILEMLDILKSETGAEGPAESRQTPLLNQPRVMWTGIALALVSVMAMTLWHVLGVPGEKALERPIIVKKTPATTDHPESHEAGKKAPDTPATSILGKDGITMRFVPGGELAINTQGSDDWNKTVQVKPFYMDEKRVTYHHFLEFLNIVKDNLTVENGLVKEQDEIWLYLGGGEEPHEQIIYEHSRFHLREIEYAAHPVVRVTWYGASAYARHYGKRLASAYEWDFVALNKDFRNLFDVTNMADKPLPKTVEHPDSSGTHMMHMTSPTGDMTNLEDKANVIREWVTKAKDNTIEQPEPVGKKTVNYTSSVTGRLNHGVSEIKSIRYPWEAFLDVGFRCALSLGNKY